ncbi:acyl--CoA ligase [Streptomyces fulvissimus]|uniref:Acyl--CoA ligase n=1 Tax=Streptomyces microflavus TaxID=1919 RepID=A0A6N9VK98_STRMI|nr:acyl--CoA ligase [Streptomyces microflavus]NEB73324.1 acyl--CoA ligase [Streptomyces microflavus]
MPHTDPPPSGQPDPERAERIHAQLTAPGAPFAVVRGERGTLEYADGPRTLREFVETTWAFGDTPFLVAGERRYSYGEFFAAASALAVRLSERYGLRPGDRAVVAMRNLPEWQIAFWAAQLAGLIAVPLSAWWTEDEFTYALDDCEPGVLLVDGERMDRVAGWALRAGARVVVFQGQGQLPDGVSIERYEDFPAPDPLAAPPDVEPRPEDDATILYTAGSTGRPRGAVATHLAQAGAALDARYRAAASALERGGIPGMGAAPVIPVTLPFFRLAAFGDFYGAMAAGGTLVLTEAEAEGEGEGEAEGEAGTEGAGGTEGAEGTAYNIDATPVTEVRIVAPSGSGDPLPDGATGELWLRGQPLLRGYWRDPGATAEAFSDGWFRTGDLAVRREGRVTVVGRAQAADRPEAADRP